MKVAKANEDEDDSNDIVAINHDDVDVADDNVTSTNDNVESVPDDVSFATFMTIYEHQDKGGYDTESVWNRLSDADKCDAIRYARLYVQQVPDAAKREWPSRFISTRPWTQIDNH